MDISQKVWWIIPFKEFDMVRVKKFSRVWVNVQVYIGMKASSFSSYQRQQFNMNENNTEILYVLCTHY